MLQIPLDARYDRYTLQVDLEGVTVGLRVYWLPRVAAWFVDALSAAGEDVAVGARLTPGAPLALPAAWEGGPPGRFICTGPDGYTHDDLGVQVQVLCVTAAAIEAAAEG